MLGVKVFKFKVFMAFCFCSFKVMDRLFVAISFYWDLKRDKVKQDILYLQMLNRRMISVLLYVSCVVMFGN